MWKVEICSKMHLNPRFELSWGAAACPGSPLAAAH